jgi:hypothetical protein
MLCRRPRGRRPHDLLSGVKRDLRRRVDEVEHDLVQDTRPGRTRPPPAARSIAQPTRSPWSACAARQPSAFVARRTAEGKTRPEIRRCLKRYICAREGAAAGSRVGPGAD